MSEDVLRYAVKLSYALALEGYSDDDLERLLEPVLTFVLDGAGETGRRYSLDDVLAHFGVTRDGLQTSEDG